MPHVVLIGDSIFDNAAYPSGGPDVVSQVRELLAPGWKATLLAVDGSTTDHVARQLARLPTQATHLPVREQRAPTRSSCAWPTIARGSASEARRTCSSPGPPSAAIAT